MSGAPSKTGRDVVNQASLSHYKAEQDLEKEDGHVISSRAAKTIFDLDILTHQAIQKSKTGLSDELRQISITDTDDPEHWTTQVPEYFDLMDVRKPPSKYVQDKFQQVVNEAFITRRSLEKNMSRRELVAFDKVLAKYLQPENLLKRLEQTIEDDYSFLWTTRQAFEHERNRKSS